MKWRQKYLHKLPQNVEVRERLEIILEKCRGKNVLHLGCVGYNEENGVVGFLHRKIMAVSKTVYGVDIDQDKLNLLRKEDIPNLICADVHQINELKFESPIEVVVAGELLEHLENPGIFLNNIAEFIKKYNCILVLTVPNAYSLRGFLFGFRGIEYSDPDHKFYFSYFTLSTFLKRYNLDVGKIYASRYQSSPATIVKNIVKNIFNLMINKFPFMADGLIFVVNGYNQ